MQVPVKLTLWFGDGDRPAADIPDTNGVPMSMILESLRNLTKGMAEILVKEAQEDVPEEGVEDYLQGMLNLDREKLKARLKQ